MKILVLQSELGVLRGGGENFTKNLFTAFRERGHEVVAAFVADRRGEYPFSMPPGIKAIPIPGWWASELGQASLSLIGSWIAPKGLLKSKWEYIQNSIHWRTHRWHKRRFQIRIERNWLEGGAGLTSCTCMAAHTWRAQLPSIVQQLFDYPDLSLLI